MTPVFLQQMSCVFVCKEWCTCIHKSLRWPYAIYIRLSEETRTSWRWILRISPFSAKSSQREWKWQYFVWKRPLQHLSPPTLSLEVQTYVNLEPISLFAGKGSRAVKMNSGKRVCTRRTQTRTSRHMGQRRKVERFALRFDSLPASSFRRAPNIDW